MASPSNPIGVHALVWAGGWSESEARTAIEASKAAGYDLIEVLQLDPFLAPACKFRLRLASMCRRRRPGGGRSGAGKACRTPGRSASPGRPF